MLVSCSAADAAGNTATASFVVWVQVPGRRWTARFLLAAQQLRRQLAISIRWQRRAGEESS
jgi:hypothetical protein